MASRMDKYNSNSVNTTQSRSKKNEQLYEQLYTNKVYTEFTDINSNNVIDLSNVSNETKYNRREDFQKNRMFNQDSSLASFKKNSNLGDNSEEISNLDKKSYDINEILENAKKNRTEDEEMKQKRYLKTVEYSIISDLTNDRLKESKDKSQKLSKDEEENLEELIHTITSNSLRKKIDDELLSDLLPTEESETIISRQLLDDLEQANSSDDELINTEREANDEDEDEDAGIDKSFYTKSMDLSEEDFEMEDDNSFIDPPKMGLVKKILIGIFVVLIISIIGYVLYRFI